MRQGKLGGKKLSFSIIHIIGLPGAGKTTLAKNLSKKYNFPVSPRLPLHLFQNSDILKSEKYREAQRANRKIRHSRN